MSELRGLFVRSDASIRPETGEGSDERIPLITELQTRSKRSLSIASLLLSPPPSSRLSSVTVAAATDAQRATAVSSGLASGFVLYYSYVRIEDTFDIMSCQAP